VLLNRIKVSKISSQNRHVPLKISERTKKTTNSLGSDTIFIRISLPIGNPIKYTDPDGNASGTIDENKISGSQTITKAVINNLGFKTTGMGCDLFVTKVLSDAGAKPNDWPDPLGTYVIDYKNKYFNELKDTASNGWNIVMMYSENETMEAGGVTIDTDPTPHMGLMNKNEKTGELTLVHYTHGEVRVQSFKNEADFKQRMPYEVYAYDTALYKTLE
jgi:hypothetical protein